jgi:uncharacterized protein
MMTNKLAVLFILFSTSVYAVTDEDEFQAHAGNPEAQYLMGNSFEKGQGNDVDLAQAVFWYEKAAANNNPAAQHRLGLMYATGTGVGQDFNKTAELFEASAIQNYSPGQMDYAMFLIGLGPAEYKKPVEAYAWLTLIKKNNPSSYADISNIMQQLDTALTPSELISARELGAEYINTYKPE